MKRLAIVALLSLPLLAAVAASGDVLGSKETFFRPKLGGRVNPDLTFRDEEGRQVRLGDYGRGLPVILVPAYYGCPMLCTLTLNDLVRGLRGVPFRAGEEFEVVVVSFDARERPDLAAAKKRAYVEEYGRPGAEEGWHFLTGEQAQIDELMDSIGFRAVWVEEQKQFAHARGILVLSPDWMITRYFLEGFYPATDLRLSLVEASEGRVGSPMDRVLLMCFNYNPVTAKYSVAILNVVRAGGLLTVGGIALFWLRSLRRGRRKAPAEGGTPGGASRVPPTPPPLLTAPPRVPPTPRPSPQQGASQASAPPGALSNHPGGVADSSGTPAGAPAGAG